MAKKIKKRPLRGLAIILGGSFGGLLLGWSTGEDKIYYSILQGIAAAFIWMLIAKAMISKKPMNLFAVALVAGLSGPAIIQFAQNMWLLNSDKNAESDSTSLSRTGSDGQPGESPGGSEGVVRKEKAIEPESSPGSGRTDHPRRAAVEETSDAVSAETPEANATEGPSSSRSLGELYAKIENKRKSLEDERKRYEHESENLEGRRRSAEIAHTTCTSGEWRFLWNESINRAEDGREQLEEDNQDIIRLNKRLRAKNKQLENERREIEGRHYIKGPRYEYEIRNWTEKIETEYFFRLENELFKGYRDYQHGLNLYIIDINNASEACQNGDLISPAMETFLTYIDQIFGEGD